MGAEHSLDLAQLDAIAAHLHLVVGAPQVLEHALSRAPSQVAAAVHTPAVGVEGVGSEPLGGQLGTGQVAACHARACDVQLPYLA